MTLINKKQAVQSVLGFAALGSLALVASVAHAYSEERIENQHTTKYFSDTVSGGGALAASITLGPTTSNLNIFQATSGLYNSRLSTRCSDNRFIETAPRKKTGTTAGDVTHSCGGNTFPIRIEGAIDDLP